MLCRQINKWILKNDNSEKRSLKSQIKFGNLYVKTDWLLSNKSQLLVYFLDQQNDGNVMTTQTSTSVAELEKLKKSKILVGVILWTNLWLRIW